MLVPSQLYRQFIFSMSRAESSVLPALVMEESNGVITGWEQSIQKLYKSYIVTLSKNTECKLTNKDHSA